MSFETTTARAAERAAHAAWRRHQADCPKCVRRRAERCRTGQTLWSECTGARDELARNREADKQPAPGQEMLF